MPSSSTRSLIPTTCLDEDAVLAFTSGTLDPGQMDRAQRHIDGCNHCRAVVDELMYGDTAAADGSPTEPTPGALPPPGLPAGTTVGRYVIVSRLGAGGMGVVYLAYDPNLDRKVALKLLRPDLITPDATNEFHLRLMREAQVLARLSHPNVVTVFDVGAFGTQIFMAMEFVEGANLTQWLKQRKRSWRRVVQTFLQAGQGLAAAHKAGLIHRDFKPDNVLIGNDGRARVTDFGLARAIHDPVAPAMGSSKTSTLELEGPSPSDTLTATGRFVGTPAYLSPEQFDGKTADRRSDIFSFCVALYEALYGERPFRADSLARHAAAVREGRVSEPSRRVRIPLGLRRLVLKGLSPAADDRFQSMDELLRDLGRDRGLLRPRTLALAASLAVVSVSAVTYQLGSRRLESCVGSEQRLAGVWDVPRQQSVRQAFVAAAGPSGDASFRLVEQSLGRYARSLVASYTSACEATQVRHEQSAETLDLKVECLNRRLDQVKALVELFERADTTVVQQSAQAVHGLTELEQCENVALLRRGVRPPKDPATTQAVQQIERTLHKSGALQLAGKWQPALHEAQNAVLASKDVPYPDIRAVALEELGSIHLEMEDPTQAESVLREAVIEAQRAGDDEVSAKAWTALVSVKWRQAKLDEADEYARLAQAVIDRLGGDPMLQSQLFNNLGRASERRGDFARAVQLHQRALTLRLRAVGRLHLLTAFSYTNLSRAWFERSDYAHAQESAQEALDIVTQLYGSDHLEVNGPLQHLGAIASRMGDYDVALRYLFRTLDLHERGLGPDSVFVAYDRWELVEPFLGKGEATQALVEAQQAVEMLERRQGKNQVDTVAAYVRRAQAFHALHRDDEAAQDCDRAVTVLRSSSGNERDLAEALEVKADILLALEHPKQALDAAAEALTLEEGALEATAPDLTLALSRVGEAQLALQQLRSAHATFERALKLRSGVRTPREHLAQLQFGLARALWEEGDRLRAVEAAEQARAGAEKAEGHDELAAAIMHWEQAHGMKAPVAAAAKR